MSLFKEVKELGKKEKSVNWQPVRFSVPEKNLKQIIQLTTCKMTRNWTKPNQYFPLKSA